MASSSAILYSGGYWRRMASSFFAIEYIGGSKQTIQMPWEDLTFSKFQDLIRTQLGVTEDANLNFAFMARLCCPAEPKIKWQPGFVTNDLVFQHFLKYVASSDHTIKLFVEYLP